MKKVALHNLGCKVNSYETDVMKQQLLEAGYEIVNFAPGADIYIINTCTVTNIADRKSRQMLHKSKKMNPEAIVVATGCYVQAAGEDLKKDEAIDIVVGNNMKNEIVKILEDYYNDKETTTIIDLSKQCEYEEMQLVDITEHTRAFIKIQDGCNQFCTYCIIPYARGRVRSRSEESVVEEVKNLAAKGFKEIVLTGIHLSSYGIDLKEKNVSLLTIITKINDIEGIERIRLGSLEQGIITEEFVSEITNLTKVCPHFHLSLQSGCADTLKRMNRRYTPDEYYEKCEILRRHFQNPAITTDVIVGFPGETEDEFKITQEFLEKVHFSEMHIFKYSKRKGTKAAVMENQIDDMVKAKRSDVLLELNEKMSLDYKRNLLGCKKTVLFEEEVTIKEETFIIGHTMEYQKVAIKSEADIINKILEVNIINLLNSEILLAEF